MEAAFSFAFKIIMVLCVKEVLMTVLTKCDNIKSFSCKLNQQEGFEVKSRFYSKRED